MPMPRTLLAAALVAAVTATPAAAHDIAGDARQDNLYTVSTDANYTVANRVDATCAYVPDRWSMDWRPTRTAGTVTSTGADWVSVTCEIWNGSYQVGEATFAAAAPAAAGDEILGDAGYPPYVMVCVRAHASFRGVFVDAPRRCHTP